MTHRNTLIVSAAVLAAALAAPPASAASLCVGNHPRCHQTLRAALAAAHDGGVIRIGRGTFVGGVTIDRSVKLIGAGRDATVIRGGGPVVTIGEFDAPSQPTVTIKGVTITGGFTRTSTQCGHICGTDYGQATALGGGIEVPPAAGSAPGATVTIEDSAITGNRAAPHTTVPSVRALCPDDPCRFAAAGGGGIDNWGQMTLVDSTVSDNVASGRLASDAVGGGILHGAGSLTLRNSVVKSNRAVASTPNGRFGEGGGIFAASGALTIDRSVIIGNRASLETSFPSGVDMNAHGGGIHVGDDGSVTIDRSRIDGNEVTVNGPAGQPAAFDAGLFVGESPLTMRHSSVSGNVLTAAVGSSEDAGPSGGALEFDGDAAISHVRVTGNRAIVRSPHGLAGATGAVVALSHGTQPAVISDSVISGNRARAVSDSGTATIQGAGLTNDGALQLRNVRISDNRGTARAPGGFAQGGGIFSDVVFYEPPVELALEDTVVTHNTLSASPGLTVEGGGLFTAFPVALTRSLIAGNTPDQCSGC